MAFDPRAFFPDSAMREETGAGLIRGAFRFHYENNTAYRAYCGKSGVTADDVENDLRLIPLIPSTVFKTTAVRTDTGEDTVKRCTSSGTQGSVSVVERDATTMGLFAGQLGSIKENVFAVDKVSVYNLGPDAEEAHGIWLSHVMGVLGHLAPMKYYVKNARFLCSELVSDLKAQLKAGGRAALVGPPVMFLNLFAYMDGAGVKLEGNGDTMFITAGGWKRASSKALTRKEFCAAAAAHFIGARAANIRDVFSMVELNTPLPECECGRKHIPVWLDVYAIDLDTFGPAPDGAPGLLAFSDAAARSFPGFIMSGDLGRISAADDCPCGRSGRCVEILRRINTIEARGCALKIQKSFEGVG